MYSLDKKHQAKILFETVGRLVYYLLSLKYFVRLLKIVYWKVWVTIFRLISQHIERLTDLSIAFDCIHHNLLIAKLAAYEFEEKALLYIYSYLENRKQCLKINITNSNFQKIISSVSRGLIVVPVFFNIFINNFSFFLCNVSVHNFADDNTLQSFAKTVNNLARILESETKLCHKLV